MADFWQEIRRFKGVQWDEMVGFLNEHCPHGGWSDDIVVGEPSGVIGHLGKRGFVYRLTITMEDGDRCTRSGFSEDLKIAMREAIEKFGAGAPIPQGVDVRDLPLERIPLARSDIPDDPPPAAPPPIRTPVPPPLPTAQEQARDEAKTAYTAAHTEFPGQDWPAFFGAYSRERGWASDRDVWTARQWHDVRDAVRTEVDRLRALTSLPVTEGPTPEAAEDDADATNVGLALVKRAIGLDRLLEVQGICHELFKSGVQALVGEQVIEVERVLMAFPDPATGRWQDLYRWAKETKDRARFDAVGLLNRVRGEEGFPVDYADWGPDQAKYATGRVRAAVARAGVGTGEADLPALRDRVSNLLRELITRDGGKVTKQSLQEERKMTLMACPSLQDIYDLMKTTNAENLRAWVTALEGRLREARA